jgi:hypothetical protein
VQHLGRSSGFDYAWGPLKSTVCSWFGYNFTPAGGMQSNRLDKRRKNALVPTMGMRGIDVVDIQRVNETGVENQS